MSTLSVSAIQNPAAGQSNILLNADGSVTLPVITGAAAPLQFQAGTLWFDTAGPALQIRNPANTSWVSLAPPVAATLAEAAAGTLTTVYSSPETTVPKDAAGMTGAAILPAGTTAQRPAAPASGMVRVNTDTLPQLEQYAGGTWQPIGVITSNLTLNVATTGNDTTGLGTVAAPWATPHRAMEYLSQYAIKQGVTVTVSVADGTYTFTTPLNLNHPNGSQIFINGGSTTGARPTTSLTGGNAVGNTVATEAANDALLQAYYNTKWQFNGCHGLVCDSGGNVTVNTVLIRGNGVAPWSGVLAGNYTSTEGYASSGGINLGSTVAVHNFGNVGINSYVGGSISAPSITATNNGLSGIATYYGGSVTAFSAVCNNNAGTGIDNSFGGIVYATNCVVRYNSGNGVYAFFGGSVNVNGATVTNNAQNGIITNYGGSISATSATASNNVQNGIITSYGGSINAQGATASNNGGYGVFTLLGGSINVQTGVINSNASGGIIANEGGEIWANGATINNNTNAGVYVASFGHVNVSNANITGNTGFGIQASGGGANIAAPSATVTGNGSTNAYAVNMGNILVTGATIGSFSPALNTVGNGNALINT